MGDYMATMLQRDCYARGIVDTATGGHSRHSVLGSND